MSEQSHDAQTPKLEPRDATHPRDDDSGDGTDVVVEGKSLTNADLRELAAAHHSPAGWLAMKKPSFRTPRVGALASDHHS